jgi:hypothetical protein
MSYLIGVILALAVCVSAPLIGLSRDRAFYPTMLIVIASYYVLFAVMGGSTQAPLVETFIMCGFTELCRFRRACIVIQTAGSDQGRRPYPPEHIERVGIGPENQEAGGSQSHKSRPALLPTAGVDRSAASRAPPTRPSREPIRAALSP